MHIALWEGDSSQVLVWMASEATVTLGAYDVSAVVVSRQVSVVVWKSVVLGNF